jgi:adenylate cyclase
MFNQITLRFFSWINRIKPVQDEIGRLRMAIGMIAAAMGIFFSLTLGIPVYLYGEPLAGWTFFILGVWLFISTVLFLESKASLTTWAYLNFIGLIITNFVATVLLGGVQSSGMLIIWILLTPLLAPILISPRQTIYWAALFLILLVAASYLPDLLGQTSALPVSMQKGLVLFNVGGISIFVLVILQLFVIQRNRYQEQSDNLLLNILPREIADILRSENRVIADAFEGASILFADVVNFTPMSAQMSPVELVNLLNEVFSHFDGLAEKHKLEKIKTIGDCYMVASGIPRARVDHAQAVTYMALDILDYVKNRDFNGHKLAFRIGINSGPVIAGVIGQKKFAYDLWGDAVNTASRMESHGTSNVIQITRNTYELIKDEFVCEPQKPVSVKGKGEMEVWYVVGKR